MIEDTVEQAALEYLRELGWQTASGPDIAPNSSNSERAKYTHVILERRLWDALAVFNPDVPDDALHEAYRQLTHLEDTTLETKNQHFHRFLVNGVDVEYRDIDGEIKSAPVKVLDFDNPGDNDWFAVNQFTVEENGHRRRLDIVLFVNGLPLVLIELKNPANEEATIRTAWNDLQTYKMELPTLFSLNTALIISDGIEARIGTLTSGLEWFKQWDTITGEEVADKSIPQIKVMMQGVIEHGRFLSLLRYFIIFEDEGDGKLLKKMGGYHQFHAVHVAITETLRAANLSSAEITAEVSAGSKAWGKSGDRRIGVVWHTQGSGKSLTMAFYAGRIITEPAMKNPTIVVMTDRNDLDDQLYSTFLNCQDLLRQRPKKAESRADLRKLLDVNSGGVVFTTIQKFLPDNKGDSYSELSARSNIVVIADEAHRSQYDFIDGFARHIRDALPSASFIGFTATPIETGDVNTRAVFGDYISIYDIPRAIKDGATVPIHYENRLAKLSLDEQEKPNIDPDFEEATEGEEATRTDKLKRRWAKLEAVVGSDKRLTVIAEDVVKHFGERLNVMDGKAMIVCMSRRICIELYNNLVTQLKHLGNGDWIHEDDTKGKIKIVMTGGKSDPPNWQQHVRTKPRRETLARRFRDPNDPFQIVIVRDMWLTGFDAPSLHTMYVDKPMRGHGLMQTISRVNRVFKDKPGGLIVDYLGIATELQESLKTYVNSGGRGDAVVDQEQAVTVMLEKYEICCELFHGFDWTDLSSDKTKQLELLAAAQEHILAQKDGKKRCIEAVRDLTQSFALAVPHEETRKIRDDVAFFQFVRSSLMKRLPGTARSDEELDHAIRQIVSKVVAPMGVIDIFTAAGLKKPDISILSEEFLDEIKKMPTRNLAVELLEKLLKGEITRRSRKNKVRAGSFQGMLEETLKRYHNRTIEAAKVIEELIQLAKEMREADARGEELGLREDELAFYEALETNDSAVKVLGDETLKEIARELVKKVRDNVTIDWTIRSDIRAGLRVMVSRTLKVYGYPPDKQKKATDTVMEQAEGFAADWANEGIS